MIVIAALLFACAGSTLPPAAPPERAAVPEPHPTPGGTPPPHTGGPPPLPLDEAMAVGDCTSVLAHPASEAPAAALARAVCALRAGHADQALVELAAEGPPELAGYRRLVRARASSVLEAELSTLKGEPIVRPTPSAQFPAVSAVLADLDGLELPGAAGREVRLLRGSTRAGRGEPAAKADLEPLLKTEAGPEARYALATLDADHPQEHLRQLWLDARPGGWDAKAAERLATLNAPVPDLSTEAGVALARKRVAALSERMRAAEARALAEQITATHPPTDRAGWVLLGRVRYNARDYAGALVAWGEAFGPPATADGTSAELFDYALCHARTGDYDTAGVVYQRVWTRYPSSKEGDFASFKIGYMAYDHGDCTGAATAFDAHRARYPSSRHLDEQLWFSARCAWKAGNRPAARAAWEEIEARRPDSSLVAGAAYWRARGLGIDGDVAGERAGYERVLSTWPSSAYAWFAAERLGRQIPPVPAVDPPAWPVSYAGRPEVARAEMLLAVGLHGWAADEIGALPAPTDETSKLALAAAWVRVGRFTESKSLACPIAVDAVTTHTRPLSQQLCYPRPAAAIVERYATNIDPAVVYGVMIAESALDPAVSSAVGARGLMQLMPEVGAGLHARLFPTRPYHPDSLFSAPYNVALGVTELSALVTALDGLLTPSSVPAAVASYNAGEQAARRWGGDKKEAVPFDEWTEDIGFVETRGYVKRVLGHAMTYRWVYGDR